MRRYCQFFCVVIAGLFPSMLVAKDTTGGGAAIPPIKMQTTSCLCADTINTCVGKMPKRNAVNQITLVDSLQTTFFILQQGRFNVTAGNTWGMYLGTQGGSLLIYSANPTNTFTAIVAGGTGLVCSDASSGITLYSYKT